MKVFFFRGLSTYGEDNAKWAFLNFGPMYARLMRAMKERSVEIIPVTGMKSGTLSEVAGRAVEFLRAHEVWQDENIPIHVMAHSAGGLAARLALRELGARKNLQSLLTIATPHRGSGLAKICVDMPVKAPGSARLLKTFGYNLSSRKKFFDELTCESVSAAFKEDSFPFKTASIVCWNDRTKWSLPMRAIHGIQAVKTFTTPSDGLVDKESQAYGEVLGEIHLDHFQQVGLFGGRKEFARMCDMASRYLVS